MKLPAQWQKQSTWAFNNNLEMALKKTPSGKCACSYLTLFDTVASLTLMTLLTLFTLTCLTGAHNTQQ